MIQASDAWSICVGIMAVLIGLGIFIVCVRAGGLIGRIEKTLDTVDQQIPLLSVPIAATLTHVGGIADTADATIARLGSAVGQLENVAAGATRTANTIGVVVTNVAAGIRKPKGDKPAGEPI